MRVDEREFRDRTRTLALKETNEILAMTVASIKTLRARNPKP